MAKRKKKTQERRLEKEIFWILGFMLFIVVLFIGASAVFKSFNTFEYEGLTFTKERVGEIPVFHHYYYFNNVEDKLIKYNLFLRGDPRENNVSVEGDKISMSIRKMIYISVDSDPDSELNNCPYGSLGVGNIASFLSYNDYNVKGGNPDFHDAKAKGEDWITCETKKYNPVISIVEGDATKLSIEGNCYTMSVASCDEFLPATERFILQTIIDARERNEIN